MASLRKLIKKSIENCNQDDIEELAGFAKNYLPILFNLYTVKPKGSDEEGHRLSCLETIRVIILMIVKYIFIKQIYIISGVFKNYK
jgi:ribosomal RNA-processing protein 12